MKMMDMCLEERKQGIMASLKKDPELKLIEKQLLAAAEGKLYIYRPNALPNEIIGDECKKQIRRIESVTDGIVWAVMEMYVGKSCVRDYLIAGKNYFVEGMLLEKDYGLALFAGTYSDLNYGNLELGDVCVNANQYGLFRTF